METKEQIGVAVIGAGAWGANHVRVWNALGDLRVVCDKDVERARTTTAGMNEVDVGDNVEEVLQRSDIRAIVIASPAVTHFQLTMQALEAGKDVLVEKPMALSEKEANEIREATRKYDAVVAVGHVMEYHPAVLELRKVISTGGLGSIRYIYAHRLNLGRVRTEENALWSFAPHDIALILRILGHMPTEVACRGGAYLRPDVADVTLMSLSFPNNVMAHVFVSWLHPFKVHRFVAVGSEQMAEFDDTADWDRKLRLFPHSIEEAGDEPPIAKRAEAVRVPLEEAEPLLEECKHFKRCVIDRTRPLTDVESGVNVLRVLETAQSSLMQSGAPIPFV